MTGLFKKEATSKNRPFGDFDIMTENAQLRHSIRETTETTRTAADQTGRDDGVIRRGSAPIGIQARGSVTGTRSAEGSPGLSSPLLSSSFGGSSGTQTTDAKGPLLAGRKLAHSMFEQKPPVLPDDSKPQAEKNLRSSTSRPDSPMMNLMLKMTEI